MDQGNHLADARYKKLRTLLGLALGGSGAGAPASPIALTAGSFQHFFSSNSLAQFEPVVQLHPWPFTTVPAGKTLVVLARTEVAQEVNAIDLQRNSDNSSLLAALITVNQTADFEVYVATLAAPMLLGTAYNLVCRTPGGDGGDHVDIQSAYILP
jgi:hypothetical protein